MGNGPNNSILLAVIFVAVLFAISLAIVLSGNPRSEFDKPADFATIEQAMAARGLQACAQGEVNWTATPGFVSGRFYDISFNCSTYNPNSPGARIWVVKFGNVEARDTALSTFETTRRHIGSGIAWSNGPLVITVDGNQDSEVVSALREAVSSTGAVKGRG